MGRDRDSIGMLDGTYVTCERIHVDEFMRSWTGYALIPESRRISWMAVLRITTVIVAGCTVLCMASRYARPPTAATVRKAQKEEA